MSRGFGKVERAILELFNKNRALEMSIRYITIQIKGTERPSSKQINSTRNAVRRLEQKGIVITKKFSLYSKKAKKPTKTRYYPSHILMVRLKNRGEQFNKWVCRGPFRLWYFDAYDYHFRNVKI